MLFIFWGQNATLLYLILTEIMFLSFQIQRTAAFWVVFTVCYMLGSVCFSVYIYPKDRKKLDSCKDIWKQFKADVMDLCKLIKQTNLCPPTCPACQKSKVGNTAYIMFVFILCNWCVLI